VSNKRRYPNFAVKLVEQSKKEVQIDNLRTNSYHMVKNRENQSVSVQ